jgi:CBS-domain-containing membrane protein
MNQTQTMAGISAGDSPWPPAGTTALVVLDEQADRPAGIITDTDVAHAVAGGKDANEVRISEVMTTDPAVLNGAMTIRDAATIMTNGQFRHLPVVDNSGLIGIVDIAAVRRALPDGHAEGVLIDSDPQHQGIPSPPRGRDRRCHGQPEVIRPGRRVWARWRPASPR